MTDESGTSEVSQEQIAAAMRKYPGLPISLAVTRYILDNKMMGDLPGLELCAGSSWGRIHLEAIGELVQGLAERLYEEGKRAVTLRLTAEDFPETYDHWEVEIVDVDAGKPEDWQRHTLAGWPCCACDSVVGQDPGAPAVVTLDKRARWDYPNWGNVLTGLDGLAVAILCPLCAGEKKDPVYAVKKEGEVFVRVPIDELEDA